MSQNAPVLIAMFIVVLALVSGAVVVANRLLRADTSEQSEPDLGSEAWRTATAEVVSILRAGNRTFLQVRYRAGRSLIRTDVLYPAAQGVVPLVTQRVPIRYDPAAPARAVYDLQRAGRTPPRVTESDGPTGPVTGGPLTRA
jgi:hypothetical protein